MNAPLTQREFPHRRSPRPRTPARPQPSTGPLDGYVRVSKVGGRTGERFISPDVQEEQIRAYAAARGLQVETVFCELDRSGATLDRPLLQHALARIASGESGGLIVARLDRFARTALEALEAIARIQRAGGEFISVEDGLDSSTPFGKAMMTILLALAELELGRVRDNWEYAKIHAVLRGIHVTATPPYGYRFDKDGRLQPVPERARAVRSAYIQRGFGVLLGDIATTLTAPEGGERFSVTRTHYLLRNPVYTGEARCGEVINPTAHKPIVTRSLWVAAQDRRARTHFNRNINTLLAGLVTCAGCGLPLKRRPLSRRHPAWHPHTRYGYFCRAGSVGRPCATRAVIADSIIEPFAVAAFFAWLRRLDRQKAGARLAALEAVAAEADRRYGLTFASSHSEHERKAAKTASAQAWLDLAAIARLALIIELPHHHELRQQWPTLTVLEQRRILSAALASVTVDGREPLPAKGRVNIGFVGGPNKPRRRPPRGPHPPATATMYGTSEGSSGFSR